MRPGVLELTNAFSPNVGGAETHLDDLTQALVERGWRVYVLTYFPLTTRVPWKRYEDRGRIKIWRLWWFGHGWFHVLERYPVLQFLYLVPRLFLGAAWWLVRRGRRVAVIHANGLAAAFCARLLGPLFGKRVVFSSHAIYNLVPGTGLARAILWITGGFDAVLTLSDASRQEYVRIGLPSGRAGRFRYWVDLNVFTPGSHEEARRETGLSSDAFVCLFVGRLIPIKGVRLLLEISRQPELREVVFVFAGVGPLAGEVAEAARANDNVVFAGRVDNTALPAYYRAAEVLCIPSQYEEGFGRVILEALACGTPVVGADCAGIREATSSDVAWLVSPKVDLLAGVLKRLANNRELINARRKACREFAEERYSVKNVDIIERALRGSRRG